MARAWLHRASGALVLAVALGACSARTLEPPTPGPLPTAEHSDLGRTANDTDGPFELEFAVSDGEIRAGAAIEAWAGLTYVGPAPKATVVASGGGVVSFSARQLDGRIELGGIMTADCAPYLLRAGEPRLEPFSKSVAITDGDPDGDVKRQWAGDRVLWLPAGRWELTAAARFTEDECGGPERSLSASVIVDVR